MIKPSLILFINIYLFFIGNSLFVRFFDSLSVAQNDREIFVILSKRTLPPFVILSKRTK